MSVHHALSPLAFQTFIIFPLPTWNKRKAIVGRLHFLKCTQDTHYGSGSLRVLITKPSNYHENGDAITGKIGPSWPRRALGIPEPALRFISRERKRDAQRAKCVGGKNRERGHRLRVIYLIGARALSSRSIQRILSPCFSFGARLVDPLVHSPYTLGPFTPH